METEKLALSVLSLILLISSYSSLFPAEAQMKGPRGEDLILRFHSGIEGAYQALKNGSIDILGYEITKDLYGDAVNDANIALAPAVDLGMYEFDINNNCTIPSYPGIRSPTNYQGFRQAIAYLVDKDYIVENSCGGFAERIDQPISAGHKGWGNKSMWYPNYPYEYDPQAAAEILDAAGFLQGTSDNPYYDPTYLGSTQKLRIHPDTGVTMPDLKICARSDDLRRLDAGDQLTANMRKLGVPVNELREDMSQLYDMVMGDFNYHVYTGGWSLPRFPPDYLYSFYHTDGWYPYRLNYVTGLDCGGFPNYPKLDQLLEDAAFALTHEDAVKYTKQALGYFTEECITIPLFSARSYWAYSIDILGVVNKDTVGLDNGYSFMNAYKASGEPLTYGIKHAPNAMNQIYSDWYYDSQCLDRMTLYSGIDVPPYDLSVDLPHACMHGYIKSWTMDTWFDPDNGETCAEVTQTYRSDAWFVEPQTGNRLENVNMTHHYASIWYLYQISDCWLNPTVADIKTIRIVDPYTIEIYYAFPCYWGIAYEGSTYIFSFNWFGKGSLSTMVSANHTADGTTGYLSCSDDVFWVIEAKVDNTILTLGVDYDIYGAYDGHTSEADVRIINPAYFGELVEITYLAVGNPYGYTAGGLPWQDAFEGAGMYYATEFTPGAGGSLTLKRNPFYWMETPPLGEVDFVRKSNGCYKIDIFDVVIAASAYGSQGTAVPDRNWVPGVDLAPAGGQINIFDIITITSKYGTEWDCDP